MADKHLKIWIFMLVYLVLQHTEWSECRGGGRGGGGRGGGLRIFGRSSSSRSGRGMVRGSGGRDAEGGESSGTGSELQFVFLVVIITIFGTAALALIAKFVINYCCCPEDYFDDAVQDNKTENTTGIRKRSRSRERITSKIRSLSRERRERSRSRKRASSKERGTDRNNKKRDDDDGSKEHLTASTTQKRRSKKQRRKRDKEREEQDALLRDSYPEPSAPAVELDSTANTPRAWSPVDGIEPESQWRRRANDLQQLETVAEELRIAREIQGASDERLFEETGLERDGSGYNVRYSPQSSTLYDINKHSACSPIKELSDNSDEECPNRNSPKDEVHYESETTRSAFSRPAAAKNLGDSFVMTGSGTPFRLSRAQSENTAESHRRAPPLRYTRAMSENTATSYPTPPSPRVTHLCDKCASPVTPRYVPDTTRQAESEEDLSLAPYLNPHRRQSNERKSSREESYTPELNKNRNKQMLKKSRRKSEPQANHEAVPDTYVFQMPDYSRPAPQGSSNPELDRRHRRKRHRRYPYPDAPHFTHSKPPRHNSFSEQETSSPQHNDSFSRQIPPRRRHDSEPIDELYETQSLPRSAGRRGSSRSAAPYWHDRIHRQTSVPLFYSTSPDFSLTDVMLRDAPPTYEESISSHSLYEPD